MSGPTVPLNVVEEVKHEAERAPTQLRLTVERNVQDMQSNLRIVMLTLVQVQYEY